MLRADQNDRSHPPVWVPLFAALVSLVQVGQAAFGQLEFSQPPISYHTTPVDDRVAQLSRDLTEGRVSLQWDERHGWLPSVLKLLDVPSSSQTLVFSKTSLQITRINPSRPRAIYYNDDVYVGWVQHGGVVELSAVDPRQGAVFYTLEQRQTDRPLIQRDQGECLSCHMSSRTQGVPGYLVRSVYTGPDGRPFFGLGTATTDHRTPLSERYGGWYVTGSHGDMRHRGNVLAHDDPANPLDVEEGANQLVLPKRVEAEKYLQPGSDLVALMLLEHQSQLHNLITRASYEARRAIHYDQIMNEALERPQDYRSDSAKRRIESTADKLVRYLLMVNEWTLTSPIEYNSAFANEFQSRGPRDSEGRSLRDLDLKTRLFRYPCSYLIYSPSITALPEESLAAVREKLVGVLAADKAPPGYEHMSGADRRAVLQILQETAPAMLSSNTPNDEDRRPPD